MPKGQLRPGFRKVAGVVTNEVYAELEAFRHERGLPNMSQAVRHALRAWLGTRRGRVQNSADGPGDSPDAESPSGVQNPLQDDEKAAQ